MMKQTQVLRPPLTSTGGVGGVWMQNVRWAPGVALGSKYDKQMCEVTWYRSCLLWMWGLYNLETSILVIQSEQKNMLQCSHH